MLFSFLPYTCNMQHWFRFAAFHLLLKSTLFFLTYAINAVSCVNYIVLVLFNPIHFNGKEVQHTNVKI